MTIQFDSFPFESALACGLFCLLALLPFLVAFRIRNDYRERQQSYPRWRNSATHNFIADPKNKIVVSVIGASLLLLNLALVVGLVVLVLYITRGYGQYGWFLAALIFVTLGGGIASGLILVVVALKRRQRAHSKSALQKPES